jgi:hypothetical protein
MSIYSSPDGAIWQKEQTLIDHDAHTATTSVNHLTFFALMGERRDATAPLTTAKLTGEGRETNFNSDVTIELQPQDPCSDANNSVCKPELIVYPEQSRREASTIDNTLFKLDEGEWEEYTEPVTVSTEGTHTLQYFSADISGNVENIQTVEFTIDKTIPEIELHYDRDTQALIFSTERDATIHEPSEGTVIAEDIAGNVNEMHYKKIIVGDLITIEFVDEHSGLYAISDEYEYFQSGEVTVRKIPTETGRLSIDANDEIFEDNATRSLHIITNRGTLKIHD